MTADWEERAVRASERFEDGVARLPEDADEQSIRAEGKDGVILIHVPKQKVVQPQPRQIQVQ